MKIIKSKKSDALEMVERADYFALETTFMVTLEKALKKGSVELLVTVYNSFTDNSEQDRRLPMALAFRMLMMKRLDKDVNVDRIGDLVRLSVKAARAEIVSVSIPVVLLMDTFDVLTVNKCQEVFRLFEELVEVWKDEIFYAACKNNILRMCNNLLRRLSRTQNTVFCGRIHLFLSKFFPFSERSGLNIMSEFNLDNSTEYEQAVKDGQESNDKELEDTAEDIPLKIDSDLYCQFWSLQDFFRNPNQCYNKAQWKVFQKRAENILQAFSSFKLEDVRASGSDKDSDGTSQSMEGDAEAKVVTALTKKHDFFPKFLTNPKLLALQLSDSNFRRAVLVQFLILFQYLQLPVKFKQDTYILTSDQADFIKDTELSVYKLLEETPPSGKQFARSVRHMLEREEMWNKWKNEGCQEFKKPEEDPPASEEEEVQRPRRPLGDILRDAARNGKFHLGNDNVSRLWNFAPDNLQACKSEERNFLPLLKTYLDTPHVTDDTGFEWRSLRLVARQSPLFFTPFAQPSGKTSDYLEQVRKRLLRDQMAKMVISTSGNLLDHNYFLPANQGQTEGVNSATASPADDDVATLDNWEYMLEMDKAAEAVRAIIEGEKSETTAADSNDVEVVTEEQL